MNPFGFVTDCSFFFKCVCVCGGILSFLPSSSATFSSPPTFVVSSYLLSFILSPSLSFSLVPLSLFPPNTTKPNQRKKHRTTPPPTPSQSGNLCVFFHKSDTRHKKPSLFSPSHLLTARRSHKAKQEGKNAAGEEEAVCRVG